MSTAESPSSSRWSDPRWWLLAAVVALPLLAAAIVYSQRTWYPALDMAMTEFRVRDVATTETPLIGLPGRIGDFPEQGSHPGPWSFFLVAPIYRLAGASAYGLQLGSIVVNTVAVGLVLWVAHRRGRAAVTIALAAVVAIAVRGYGLELLTFPWNPYFPLLLWLLVLISAWAVLEGDRWMVLFVVAAGSVAAQTHVPYLLPCVAVSVVALGALAWRWRGGSSADRDALFGGVALGGVIWLAPFAEQLVRDPGNISQLIDHFTGTPVEDSIGIGEGTTVFLRHLDLPRALTRALWEDSSFLDISGQPTGIAVGGIVVLLLWVGAVAVAARIRHVSLLHLHGVLGVAMAVGWISMTRIFGRVWFYLTLWAWGTSLLVALAIAWTALAWWQSTRAPIRSLRGVLATSAVILVIATLLSLSAAPSLEVPEHRVSEAVGATIDPTVEAIETGVGAADGAGGTYVVFWQDAAYMGSPGYGFLNELERRGFDVGVHPTWTVPVGEQRVLLPGEFDAEIHYVTGSYIDEWREREGFVEVVYVDDRTDEEMARYAALEAEVIDQLEAAGRGEVVPMVTTNLFGAMLQPDLPRDIERDLQEMHDLSVPVAVFIAPPGNSH